MCTFTFTGNVQVGFQLQIEYDILMYLKLKSTFKRNTVLFAIDSPHVSLFYIRFFQEIKNRIYARVKRVANQTDFCYFSLVYTSL